MAPDRATLRTWSIDSSILLGALANGKADCAGLLRMLDDVNIRVTASTLLIAECARVPDPENQKKLDLFLASSRIHWVQLSRELAIKAQTLTATHARLRGPDAVHLASAIEGEAEAFFAVDRGFPYEKTIGGVLVCRPTEFPGQQPMTPQSTNATPPPSARSLNVPPVSTSRPEPSRPSARPAVPTPPLPDSSPQGLPAAEA